MTTSSREPRRIDPFPMDFIKGVADVLAQTEHPGLSNSEIDAQLQMAGISQREQGSNKRESLYITLNNKQHRQGLGNCVAVFITKAMAPVHARPQSFWATARPALRVHGALRIPDQ